MFPQSGEIHFLGRPLTEHELSQPEFNHSFRSKVGLVFQNPDAQLFCPTVADEVAFGPLQLGLAKETVSARVDDILRLLRIESLRERTPYELSGGEKKRVAIASVLATGTEVILMDEPTATLDPRSRWELVDIILELQQVGKTIVAATNDLEIVPAIADRLIVMGENKTVVAQGPVHELLSNEEMLFQANLIHVHSHKHDSAQHKHLHAHPGISKEHHPGS